MIASSQKTVFICGGDELASATAVKLFNSGFDVLLAASDDENLLRYHLCMGDTLVSGQKTIENATATLLSDDILGDPGLKSPEVKFTKAVYYAFRDRRIPVIHLSELAQAISFISPGIIINFYSKRISPVSIDDAPLVIGMYPLHKPGVDSHVVIDSRLSFFIGRVYTPNCPIPDDDQSQRFFHQPFAYCQSPVGGVWLALKNIGDAIAYNEALGKIEGIEIRSPHDGQIWGMTHSGKMIEPRSKIAMIFQGKPTPQFRYLGFKENTIAGGILEAILQYAMV